MCSFYWATLYIVNTTVFTHSVYIQCHIQIDHRKGQKDRKYSAGISYNMQYFLNLKSNVEHWLGYSQFRRKIF